MNKRAIIYLAIVLGAVLGGIAAIFYYSGGSPTAGAYDEFAKCLSDRGAIMYGTKTCPYCAKQKQMFGDSFRYVRYVECTVETEECVAAGVERVPLWIFPNGERLEGLQQFESLSSKTGCAPPAGS